MRDALRSPLTPCPRYPRLSWQAEWSFECVLLAAAFVPASLLAGTFALDKDVGGRLANRRSKNARSPIEIAANSSEV